MYKFSGNSADGSNNQLVHPIVLSTSADVKSSIVPGRTNEIESVPIKKPPSPLRFNRPVRSPNAAKNLLLFPNEVRGPKQPIDAISGTSILSPKMNKPLKPLSNPLREEAYAKASTNEVSRSLSEINLSRPHSKQRIMTPLITNYPKKAGRGRYRRVRTKRIDSLSPDGDKDGLSVTSSGSLHPDLVENVHEVFEAIKKRREFEQDQHINRSTFIRKIHTPPHLKPFEAYNNVKDLVNSYIDDIQRKLFC